MQGATMVGSPDRQRYLVVLRARSHVTVQRDAEIRLENLPVPSGGRATVRILTRRGELDGYLVPRELILAVDLESHSIDEAVEAARFSDQLWAYLAVAANASIGEQTLFTAFQSHPAVEERPALHEFHDAFASIDRELPVPTRYLRPEATVAFVIASLVNARGDRLYRAADQYRLALMHWIPSRPLIALGHLFMGVEALSGAALDLEKTRRGATDEDLAREWAVRVDPATGRWRPGDLRAAARLQLIFRGDRDCHNEVAEASNIYEHGFDDYGRAVEIAIRRRDQVAAYLRDAIVRYSGCDPDSANTLLSPPMNTALEITGFASRLEGFYSGPLAAADIPYMDWHPSYQAAGTDEQGTPSFTLTDNYTTRFPENVTFHLRQQRVFGPRGAQITPGPVKVERRTSE